VSLVTLFRATELKPDRFCAERLQSLIGTLQLNRLDEYSALREVATFATLVATYEKGRSGRIISSHFNTHKVVPRFPFDPRTF